MVGLVPRSTQDTDESQGTLTLELELDVPEGTSDNVRSVQCMYHRGFT